MLGVDPGASHSFELNVRPADYAGQPEAADGGAQHVGVFFRITNHQAVVRAVQRDLTDMSAERPSAVMILAVNIVGDSAADSNKACAGRDRKKPALGKAYIDDVGNADSTFATDRAS